MIKKKCWKERRIIQGAPGALVQTTEWAMEGWYLFGFIPLYVRDLNSRGTWGDDLPEAQVA